MKFFTILQFSKLNSFIPLEENLENITTQMVLFTVWFICLLVVGSYVCKFVCQFVGWVLFAIGFVCLFVGGVMFGIGFVCLLVGGYVIT